MKLVNADELVSAVPVMTRKERLAHWAALVRYCPCYLYLFSNMEYWPDVHLDASVMTSCSSFELAANDPTFQKMGIGHTFRSIMNFFSLTKEQLHAFSCDCGGSISNSTMANRIEAMS